MSSNSKHIGLGGVCGHCNEYIMGTAMDKGSNKAIGTVAAGGIRNKQGEQHSCNREDSMKTDCAGGLVQIPKGTGG